MDIQTNQNPFERNDIAINMYTIMRSYIIIGIMKTTKA